MVSDLPNATAFSVSSERHWQRRVNGIAKVPNSKSPAVGVEPSIVRSPVEALTHSATAPHLAVSLIRESPRIGGICTTYKLSSCVR